MDKQLAAQPRAGGLSSAPGCFRVLLSLLEGAAQETQVTVFHYQPHLHSTTEAVAMWLLKDGEQKIWLKLLPLIKQGLRRQIKDT